jgi:hypothetical protein
MRVSLKISVGEFWARPSWEKSDQEGVGGGKEPREAWGLIAWLPLVQEFEVVAAAPNPVR